MGNNMEEIIINEKTTELLVKITPFMDYTRMSRIVNKLTDYAEPLMEGKLSGIINFNYSLNSSQTNMVIDLLIEIQALSRIYSIAQKGKRDLEPEYISNIFSDVTNPANISSYLSIRTLLENRLNHQVQQYNINMNKSNTTLAIPINELRGHVKTYRDLMDSNVTISHKAQHGFVAASLHDAYLIILNRRDWWDDRTYMKYFFNEDEPSKRNITLISRVERLTLKEIDENVKRILAYFQEVAAQRLKVKSSEEFQVREKEAETTYEKSSKIFTDKLMLTPFGRQYGEKIDSILKDIFDTPSPSLSEEEVRAIAEKLYHVYKTLPSSLNLPENIAMCENLAYFLLSSDMGLKKFAETFIYNDRRISFSKFFTEKRDELDDFATKIFVAFFEYKFSSLFRIIKSLDMKQYACAFIIKRIYILKGEDLSTFGFFLIKAIAKFGKIKAF